MLCLPSHDVVFAIALSAALASGATASAEGLASMSRGWTLDEQGGAALFANVCAACHQSDGRGAAGAAAYPSLVGDKRLASSEYLESLLFNGQRGMPPVGRMMSDRQVADVINYVRARFGEGDGETLSVEDVAAARPKAARD
jgi:mono/diheme cytochrome c family protein